MSPDQFLTALKSGKVSEAIAALEADPQLAFTRDNNQVSALVLAVYHRQPQIAQAILQARAAAHGARPNGSVASAGLDVFEAAAVGDAQRVAELLREHPEAVNGYSSDGWTPLHLAAAFGHLECARILLEHQADVHARSRNGMNNMPLHAAVALSRSLEMAKLLIEKGANVNARQHGGFTPLHAAAFNGSLEIARLLLSKGAEVGTRTDDGQSALDLALGKGHQQMVELLEAKGAA